LRENRRRDDQRSSQFARYRINQAVLCVEGVVEFLSIYLQNYLDWKFGRIFGQADQFLIIHSEGAERSRFAKPVRLRIRSILGDFARQILRNELVGRRTRIDFYRLRRVGASYLRQGDWHTQS